MRGVVRVAWLVAWCVWRGAWRGAWQRKCLADFCEALNVETAKHNALGGQALGPLGAAAVLLWTSDLKFEGMPA